MPPVEDLQDRWNTLYRETLPRLAKARDSVQPNWPVHLDHCFARIILDNAIGITQPWTGAIKAPAVQNMTAAQLEDAIELGESVAVGMVNLDELNRRSLELRDKVGPPGARGTKRKAESMQGVDGQKQSETISKYFRTSPKSEKTAAPRLPSSSPTKSESLGENDIQSGSRTTPPTSTTAETDKPALPATAPSPPMQPERNAAETDTDDPVNSTALPAATAPPTVTAPLDPLAQIAQSDLTLFRKEVLSLLCQVPRGHYTTYAALSAHISAMTHKTCARAVGNAMRNNPFAPAVPCHRVLAADGRIGGFGGQWGEEGGFAGEKRALLRGEGVRFDGVGRVVGAPFRAFSMRQTWLG